MVSDRSVWTSEAPEPVRLLDADGAMVADDRYPLPGVEVLLRRYRSMLVGRRLNEQAGALVRQGRLAVYPSSHGQEACQVAAAAVLRERDWLFPTYRDTVAVVERGVDPVEVLTMLRGGWHCGYDPVAHRVAPQATPLATQLSHAVGVAHAARLRGEDTIVLALCGDGATSEGDFHEALNFAAVFAAPVVFLVQDNKYAISVPLARQSVAPSLAHKGIGYGVPAVRVDGNDVAALCAVLDEAVARGATGGGPTLVEADTYRIQAHTNADDATRYRTDEEVRHWAARDPLARLRAHLLAHDALDPDREAEFTAEAERVAAQVRAGLAVEPAPDPAELFAHVHARPTPQLAEQEQLLRTELAAAQEAR
ncbi:thiamine pyrophosphate-dependent dehydrogenase E1 component subunit alpha [Pseudonocardia hispaniensis]|uniref:2-oxoisovalerate dehydrogenase subunit alpha n=1 Tax=Pseudonocardia hispaniensis TaxID=904933 RepID=A0ABW1J4L7_9PSEU